MSTEVSNEYLRNSVLTATPEQLQMMLYDGAIRFTTQAREAMRTRKFDVGCELLLRAQRIVLELQKGLRRDINPTLCDKLSSLYDFVYRRLVDANMTHDDEPFDDALQILQHQRETWELLLGRLHSDSVSNPAPADDAPQALSLQC